METYSEMELAIEVLSAQELLVQMRASDFPNAKNSDRQKIHRDLYKKAFPSFFTTKRSMTWDDLKRSLNG
jgi:hypothetical protein